ncbi:kinase-like protein [Serendipita vermifera]|nr:kinase-like protein [Serendipita vermifera]
MSFMNLCSYVRILLTDIARGSDLKRLVASLCAKFYPRLLRQRRVDDPLIHPGRHARSSDATNRSERRVPSSYEYSHPKTITDLEDNPFNVPNLTGQVTRVRADAIFVGNYSFVYIGEWDQRLVAIKVIREVGTLSTTRRKIKREREVWASLDHANIVPLYGYCVGHEGFGMYGALISPWYHYGHAASYIQQYSIAAPQRFALWCDVIRGMEYLHERNPVLIHGDLKPANILIDDEGHARICDFGLARIFSEGITGLTTTTTHTGTTRYLAYELIISDQPIPATYGLLGARAWTQFLFLMWPYANRKTPAKISDDIKQGLPPATHSPVPCENSGPISKLWGVLNACWDLHPEGRPSAQQLQEFVTNHEADLVAAFNGI